MHQYHLGINEEEREGELVVSKIFYQTQPRQCVGNINWSEQNVSSKGLIGTGAGDEICGVAAALQSLGSGDVISRVNTNPFTRALDEVYHISCIFLFYAQVLHKNKWPYCGVVTQH